MAPPLTVAMHKMGQRLKLRHKVTGVEKGPFFGWYPADWVKLYVTWEYDFIRSSDVFDKNGREIFAGDLLSVGDGPPFEVVEKRRWEWCLRMASKS